MASSYWKEENEKLRKGAIESVGLNNMERCRRLFCGQQWSEGPMVQWLVQRGGILLGYIFFGDTNELKAHFVGLHYDLIFLQNL